MILFLFLLKTILCQSQSINTLSVCVDDSGSRYLQGTSWTKEIGGKIQRCECLNGGNGQYSCGYTNEAAFLAFTAFFALALLTFVVATVSVRVGDATIVLKAGL